MHLINSNLVINCSNEVVAWQKSDCSTENEECETGGKHISEIEEHWWESLHWKLSPPVEDRVCENIDWNRSCVKEWSPPDIMVTARSPLIRSSKKFSLAKLEVCNDNRDLSTCYNQD